MYRINVWVFVVLFVLSGMGANCFRGGSSGMRLVAANSIIADVMEQVLGYTMEESADRPLVLDVIIPRAENNHSSVPRPSTGRIIEQADLIVINGLGLEEGAVGGMVQKSGADILDLSEGIVPLAYGNVNLDDESVVAEHEGEEHESCGHGHSHGEYDPHHWLTPLNVIKWVSVIVEKLSLLDEDNRDVYMENARMYVVELQSLHREIKEMMADMEPEQRNVLVGHEAFTYYAAEYGLNVHGSIIPSLRGADGLSSGQNLVRLGELMKNRKIPLIILDKSSGLAIVSLANTVMDMAPYPVAVVQVLFDSLPGSGERGASYIELMRYNSELLVQAFSG